MSNPSSPYACMDRHMPTHKMSSTGLVNLKTVDRQAAVPKDLTVRAIQEQIPKHFFEQDTLRSCSYLLRDFAQIAVAGLLTHSVLLPVADAVDSLVAGTSYGLVATLCRFAIYNAYWFIQGLNFTAVWVLAHECGHRAFSPSRTVNDVFGLVLHSALLVPYHSWRISHGNHHKNTNHVDLDTVFVPPKYENALTEAMESSALVSFIQIVIMLTVGWPGYLIGNVASQKYPRRANHFEPSSPIFQKKDFLDIVVSDIGIAIALAAIGYAIYTFGFANVAFWYLAPYLWNNAWLVYITYLQHSDVRLPHYNRDEWNFVRGALCTVDRSFGAMINPWLHHINDSHVVHHLFSTMPFFNAIQVTRKHLRGIVGTFYLEDDRPLWTMLWESWRNCLYVVPKEGVAFFHR